MTSNQVVSKFFKRYAVTFCITYAIFRILLPAFPLDLIVACAVASSSVMLALIGEWYDVGNFRGQLIVAGSMFVPMVPLYLLDLGSEALPILFTAMEPLSFIATLFLGMLYLYILVRPKKIKF